MADMPLNIPSLHGHPVGRRENRWWLRQLLQLLLLRYSVFLAIF